MMASAKPRFTWRKEPNETGLRRIIQGPRSWRLMVEVGNGAIDCIAAIIPDPEAYSLRYYVRTTPIFGVPYKNTDEQKRYWTEDQLSELKKHVRVFVAEHFKLDT